MDGLVSLWYNESAGYLQLGVPNREAEGSTVDTSSQRSGGSFVMQW